MPAKGYIWYLAFVPHAQMGWKLDNKVGGVRLVCGLDFWGVEIRLYSPTVKMRRNKEVVGAIAIDGYVQQRFCVNESRFDENALHANERIRNAARKEAVE
jgi:hypothetical protein